MTPEDETILFNKLVTDSVVKSGGVPSITEEEFRALANGEISFPNRYQNTDIVGAPIVELKNLAPAYIGRTILQNITSLSYHELRYAIVVLKDDEEIIKKVIENIGTADLLDLLKGLQFADFDVDVSVEVNNLISSGYNANIDRLPTFAIAGADSAGNTYTLMDNQTNLPLASFYATPDRFEELISGYTGRFKTDITSATAEVTANTGISIAGNMSDVTKTFQYNENLIAGASSAVGGIAGTLANLGWSTITALANVLVDSTVGLDYQSPMGILESDYRLFLIQAITEGDSQTTIKSNFDAVVGVSAKSIMFLLLYEYEYNNRVAFAETINNLGAGADINDILDAAEAASLADLAGSGLLSAGGITQDNTPTDPTDIEKFYEQCVLLASMEELKLQFTDTIKEQAPDESSEAAEGDSSSAGEQLHSPAPYQERFYMVEVPDGQNDRIVNFLNAPRGKLADNFLNITPDIQSFLTPKIRLYKVFNDGDKLKQVEFIFKNSTDNTNILKELFKDNDRFFRGSGYGIKDFSFSFNGTTPATAKNDITADLTLFFQDFSDFVTPVTTSEGTFKFVDLILYDKKNINNPSYGYGSTHPDQYSPAYYRIRADVGWRVPENHPQFDDACRKRNIDPDQVREAIRKTNKSYYLNMVEHDLNFKADGTVEIKAQYRGYIESVLKGTEMDALVDQSIIDDRKNRAQSLITALKTCQPGEIARIKRIYAAEEQKLREKLYTNTYSRLQALGRVRRMDVQSDGGFRVDGYFVKPPQIIDMTGTTAPPNGADTFNYYFLGDLLYVMLDVLYSNRDIGEYKSAPIQKTKFILPTIDFENFFEDSGTFSINLAQIPVADKYFQEWFTEHVIKAKRQSYPIMFYLRDLLNNLIADALIDVCLNRNYRKSFNFQTTSINASGDPLAGQSSAQKAIILLNKEEGEATSSKNLLPFTVDEDGDINDITNYVLVYAAYSSILPNGRGDYTIDIKNGVYHFHLGQDRGIIHDVKFSKVDMAYIREARYMREGVDGLLQLGAVYRATLTMFGNTLFYPGMLIYINPFGIGGEDFLPNDKNSMANKLGLGGYHLIEKVNSSISSGLFKTTVDAMFVYSGDGDSRFNIQGKQKENEEEDVENPDPTEATCPGFVTSVENDARTLLRTGESGNSNDELASDIEQQQSGSPLISPSIGLQGEATTSVPDADGDGIPDNIDNTPNGDTQ